MATPPPMSARPSRISPEVSRPDQVWALDHSALVKPVVVRNDSTVKKAPQKAQEHVRDLILRRSLEGTDPVPQD